MRRSFRRPRGNRQANPLWQGHRSLRTSRGLEGTLRPGQGLTSPVVITEAKPKYTAEAMRARIEGIVEMEVIVLADGTVGPVRVVRSLDKELGLDAQAMRAVKEWTFKPGRKDGQPVNVLVNIEMHFTVRDKR